jgi:hypothetical protein
LLDFLAGGTHAVDPVTHQSVLATRSGGWHSRRDNRGHEHTAHRRNPPGYRAKKAAYAALADVLDNQQSRQELIDQLRKVAATPPQEPVPVITPPQLVEQKTVLENVTEVSSHYGEEFASRFAQLYRNITSSRTKRLIRKPLPVPPGIFYCSPCWYSPSGYWCALA